jgi:predicted ATP-grasp superfamily ATP-dependent carboligase
MMYGEDMPPLIWDRRPEELRAPAMICAFAGWNDAGDSASGAVAFLASALTAQRFARVDSQEFYDFQANRPGIRLKDGRVEEIRWPSVEIYEAMAPRATRDLVLVQGAEPSLRWRAFSSHLVDLAEALGVQLIVTLGAFLGDVAHSRPVAMSGFASDPALVERLGISPSSYEGPTGIIGALHGACQEAAVPSASLWAAVPHYVAAASNPKATLALVRRVEDMVGVSVDVSELERAAGDFERQVTLAVQSEPEIQAFVERLEEEADAEAKRSPTQVPDGDTLAREFQRFLKQRGIRP